MKKLIPIIVLFLTVSVFAQKRRQAEMIDEFGDFNCEMFKARIDNFYVHLFNQPLSRGYIVISGDNTSTKRRLAAELLLESAIVARRYDRSRVEIIQGPDRGGINVQLWVVPSGISKPDFSEVKWSPIFQKTDKPYLLDSEMSDICPSAPFELVAKQLLDSNTNGLIYVVVHGKTSAQRSRQLKASTNRLERIDPHRISYLLRHSEYKYSDYYFAVGICKRSEFRSWM